MEYIIILPILISIVMGVLVLITSFVSHTKEKSKAFINDNFKYTGVGDYLICGLVWAR